MKLTGVIEYSLGGFITIRGYAPLADIAKCSKAEEFQRELIPEHKEELRAFFQRNQNLFFSEVVLAHTLKYDFNADGAQTGINPIQDIVEKREFVSNVDGIKFEPLKTEVGKNRVVNITIDNNWLIDNQPFSRIDGNHRISAYLEENEHSPLEEYNTPFCIILFQNNDDSLKNKKILFHNINSKARRLTSEEELKGIVANGDFTEDELRNSFGINYVLTRNICALYPNEHINEILSNTNTAFKNKDGVLYKNSVFFKLIDFLFNNELIEANTDINIVREAITEVNNQFYRYPNLSKAVNSAFFIVSVGIQLTENIELVPFLRWLSKNQLGELDEVKAQSLYDIYVKMKEPNPKVFVAMPYNAETIPDYRDAYQRMVNEINEENPNINLELNPIMLHVGESQDIVPKMINQIDNCSIFIADISEVIIDEEHNVRGPNPNVAYELGYAKGKGKPFIIVQERDNQGKVPFDYTQTSRTPYHNFESLRTDTKANIKEILRKKGFEFD